MKQTVSFLAILLVAGCGKSEQSAAEKQRERELAERYERIQQQMKEANKQVAEASKKQQEALQQLRELEQGKPVTASTPKGILGKWVTNFCRVIEFRQDGKFIVQPFNGSQSVGTYTHKPELQEIHLTLAMGPLSHDAIWKLLASPDGTLTLDVREKEILGRQGRIPLTRLVEGTPQLKVEEKPVEVPEGQAYKVKPSIIFKNVGTGTLLLEYSRAFNGWAAVIAPSQEHVAEFELEGGPSNPGLGNRQFVNYEWRDAGGQILQGQAKCQVNVRAAETIDLQLGKPLRVGTETPRQWVRIRIPEAAKPIQLNSYALCISPGDASSGLFDSDRKYKAKLDPISESAIGSFRYWWLSRDTPGEALIRIDGNGRQVVVAFIEGRSVSVNLYTHANKSKPVAEGEWIGFDGRECQRVGFFSSLREDGARCVHQTCWAALSFEAKKSRLYFFLVYPEKLGGIPGINFWSKPKYEAFLSDNKGKGLAWGFDSTVNQYQCWRPDADGLHFLVMHANDEKRAGVALYEFPSFDQGEFTLSNEK